MSDKSKFSVRPFSRPARPDLKDSLRVNLSATALLSLKLRAGDQCLLCQEGRPDRPAIAWQAVEKIQDTVIQISKTLQDLYGLKLGDKVSVSVSDRATLDARTVKVHEMKEDGSPMIDDDISEGDRSHWEWILSDSLSRAENMMPGLVFDSITARGQKRSFIISYVDGSDSKSRSLIRRFGPKTTVSISHQAHEPMTDQVSDRAETLKLDSTFVGGLQRQLGQINFLLRRFEPEFRSLTSPYNYRPSQGLLLYGTKGTGKSLVIDKLASCPWRSVIRWSAASTARIGLAEQLSNSFSDALSKQPCLVIIEQIAIFASKRDSPAFASHPSLSPTLQNGFETIRNGLVLVVAEVRHPNDIDDSLRSQTRFGVEIELPVPAAKDRLEILRSIRGERHEPSDDLLKGLAERTHGYVGADLFTLSQRIIEVAAHNTLDFRRGSQLTINGLVASDSAETAEDNGCSFSQGRDGLQILPDDVATALASREIKLRLQRAVSRPLRQKATMARLNLRANRGVLLYGPPGCSKTLLVKALATEAGLNFLAVKGAELVSTYVGESERAVREVFRKARAASPSIIFFDEVDSIAAVRTGTSDHGTGSRSGSGSNSLNMLTTLLNEMDGFEQLRNVLVVAATNRPEILDPALLRPGRLDHLVYVGPPDLAARREILQIWLAKSDAHDDVDLDALADMTDGYSGAEMVSICETAAGLAMDEQEAEEAATAQAGSEPDPNPNPNPAPNQQPPEATPVIRMAHLTSAIDEVPRGITDQVIQAYLGWGNRGGGVGGCRNR